MVPSAPNMGRRRIAYMIYRTVQDDIYHLNLISTHIKSLTGLSKIKLYQDEEKPFY